jgi:hypothetical protein
MTRDDRINVGVPADLKAALQRLADTEDRKLADNVCLALRRHVENVTRKRNVRRG